jgi:lactocepin
MDRLDVGGRIHRFTSVEGASWTDAGIIDPGASGTLLGKGLFHNPHLVTDGGAEGSVIFQELCPDASIEGFAGYLWGPESGLVGRQLRPVVTRISGTDRYAQSAAVAKRAFPQGTSTVVIASGENFADALVAAPLAKALGAPILLVRHDQLPAATLSAVTYLRATNAIFVGGPNSVNTSVATALRRAHVTKIERIAGRDRYDTSARIADRLRALVGRPDTVYIASGEKFPDGLSVSAVAASRGEPILLVRANAVPSVIAAEQRSLAPRRTVVVGGPPSVSLGTAAALGATERLAGPTRYETAAAVAAFGLRNGLSPRRVVVTSGEVFPDCLTSSVLAARLNGVVLLTPRANLAAAAAQHLSVNASASIDAIVCGGTPSVSAATYGQIGAALAQ